MKKLLMIVVMLSTATMFAAEPAKSGEADKNAKPVVDPAKQLEARAQRMVKSAVSLFEQKEDERAIGMLEAVLRMYPTSQARFKAALELGRHFVDKRNFERAQSELRKVAKADDPELRAEALILMGQLHIAKGEGGEAVMVLRRVTQEFPTSLFANDAFFMIGQLHFEAGRWARASDAFQMVGTAVPASESSNAVVLAEAGQRVFAHVRDKDLVVLGSLGKKARVRFVSGNGDYEISELEPFGRHDGDFIASVKTVGKDSKPNDGVLTVHGADKVVASYIDVNNEVGDVNVKLDADANIVSSAVVSFMDGAERQQIRGVFVNQPTYIHLRDYDLDMSPNPDVAKVIVRTQYRERPEPAPGETQAPPPAPDAPWLTREEITVSLTESAPRSGLFKGRIYARLMSDDTNSPAAKLPPNEIYVKADDRITVEYEDVKHLEGTKMALRTSEAAILIGGSTEPQSIVAHSNEATIQAKKLLLEAQLLCKWGAIFKDVGLQENAQSKAEEGLKRIEDIFALAEKNTLERSVIEETYEAKWNLHFVANNMAAAVEACYKLVKLYPDTLLADRAFMQIANARIKENTQASLSSAVKVLQAIIGLPNSPLKAEAQFRIGEVLENQARASVPRSARGQMQPDFSGAMREYRRCAETYPSSSYAGEAYKRIVDYDVSIKNYTAATEILERVFEDYPDAPWLDDMLLKWGVVMHRLGNSEGAKAKFQRIIEEYPGGKAAKTAVKFLKKLSDN